MERVGFVDFRRFVARSWLAIIGCTVLGLVSGYGYSEFIQQPLYKSEARLLLVDRYDQSPESGASLAGTYADVFKSRSVLGVAADQVGGGLDYEAILSYTSATATPGSAVIALSVAAHSPRDSHEVMLAAIATLQGRMASIYGVDNIEVVDEASLPVGSYNMNQSRDLVTGGLSGFALSIVILLLSFDYRGGGVGRSTRSRSHGVEEGESPEVSPVIRRDAAPARSSLREDSRIILGDDDDIEGTFLFDEAFLKSVEAPEAKVKPRPKKKSAVKTSSKTRK